MNTRALPQVSIIWSSLTASLPVCAIMTHANFPNAAGWRLGSVVLFTEHAEEVESLVVSSKKLEIITNDEKAVQGQDDFLEAPTSSGS